MTDKPVAKVAFATPCLTHTVSIEYLGSMLQTDWLLASKGYDRAYLTQCGDQFVANVRSRLAKDFLVNHPGVENFFFIDDDLGWPAAKAVEFIERNEDVLCGVYPKRSDDEDWPVVLYNDGSGELVERDGLIRALRGPTGFMCIKRRVIEAIAALAPSFKVTLPNGEVEEIPRIFVSGTADDGFFWSEDYVFSEAVNALGFEIWVDPDVAFSHRGPKAWKGVLADVLPTFRERAMALKAAVEQTRSDAA